MQPHNILFIPVSSPSGIGEYMRSIVIADALQAQWPNCQISFILNEQVSYLKQCPYKVYTCQDTPTKDVKTVNNIIKAVTPELVIFDASGRASQFRQAKAVGAKVAFISQHKKKRNRGLKLNRLFYTDIHWVVQPNFIMTQLSLFQRVKLKLFNKKAPENIGPVFQSPALDRQKALLEKYNLTDSDYILFNAGSGGHKVNGTLATDIYYQAAQSIQRLTTLKCVVVFGSNYPNELPQNSQQIVIKSIDNQDFISLISTAKACVISAGDTLLQCIALKTLSVAAAISPDQPARLQRCHQENLVIAAKPTLASLVEHINLLIEDETLAKSMAQIPSGNGLNTIVSDINRHFTLTDKVTD